MKLSKYIMTLSGITALCLASVACTESIEYHPGAESHGPYFPLDVAPQQVLDDAGFFEVTVARTGNLAATSFEVTSNADPEIFTTAPQVSFADGSLTGTFRVDYDAAKIEAGKFYDVTFSLGEDVEPNNYGYSSMDYRLLKPITEWTDYGTGSFYNDIAGTLLNNIKLQWMRNFDRTDYRFVNLLGEEMSLDIYYDEKEERFFCPKTVAMAAGTTLPSNYGDIYVIDNYTWWTKNPDISSIRECAYAKSEFLEEEGMMALNLCYGMTGAPTTPYGMGFCYFILDGVGEWSQMVAATYKDGWLMPRLIEDYNQQQGMAYSVYVQQNKTNPNRYRMVNIYKAGYDNLQDGYEFGNPTVFNYNISDGFDFIEFDTTDPDYIVFPRQFSGYEGSLADRLYIGDEKYEIGDYASVYGTEGKEEALAQSLNSSISSRNVITVRYPVFNGREKQFDEDIDMDQIENESELGDVVYGLVLPKAERSTCTLTLPRRFEAPAAREAKARSGAVLKAVRY